jgi:hypothetical protein
MVKNMRKDASKTKGETNVGLFLIAIFVLLLVLVFGLYFLYQNIPGSPVDLNPVIIKEPVLENKTYLEVKQFYPNMKFNHNRIAYYIDPLCDSEKRERMLEAFDKLIFLVGFIEFYEVDGGLYDIEVSCSGEIAEFSSDEYFIAGEGGAREIIRTNRYSIIRNGTVILHGNPTSSLECGWANVELHELIHVLGFQHSEDPKSLMYPILEDCDQELDESIIYELKRLYSEPDLAELYFDELKAIKKRKYLDFNLTVRNSGSVNAKNANFSVFEDDRLIKSFSLKDKDGEIKYGAGIIISIGNLKLKNLNPEEIKFVIDYDNLVEEIDESNNIAVVNF